MFTLSQIVQAGTRPGRQAPVPASSDEVVLPATLRRVFSNRIYLAVITCLVVTIYLWNAIAAIDYPEYDEAAYFSRGYHLLLGDWQVASVTNLNGSPLSVVYYALWYAILHTPNLYPWVMASSLLLLGLGAYWLLSRFFHPVLSCVLALATVIGSAPFDPGNANYYLGAAVLWISLALLGNRVWQRGLAALGVLIAAYARPEFLIVLAALIVGLAIYEWREWRHLRLYLRWLAVGYAPLALALLLSARVLLSAPGGGDYRSAVALPWSYNDFYHVRYPAQFHGSDSYADPWVIYQKDFGPLASRSLTSTVLALAHNPAKAREYLAFDLTRLGASFGTAALHAAQWRLDAWSTRLQVDITSSDTSLFGAGALLLFALAAVAWLWLRSAGALKRVPVRLPGPALIGLASLMALIVPLLLINPHQRFFMLYPVVWLLIGSALLVIGTAAVLIARRMIVAPWRVPAPATRRQATMLAVLLLVLFVQCAALLTPQPYSVTPPHSIARTLAFMRAHVPQRSVIVGEPVISYGYYLNAEGWRLRTLSPADYAGHALIGAFEADPTLRYLLLTRMYPPDVYAQWLADWRATFPQLPWTLVARQSDPDLQLYALPPHGDGYGQVSYALWLVQARQLGLSIATLPPFGALDYSQTLSWRSSLPGHYVRPIIQPAWGVSANAFIMHPNYAGIDAYPDVSPQVETSLPPAWSGRTLLFLATLAPWAASQPDAQGTILTFAIPQTGFSQTIEILNFAQQHWVPVAIPLPTTADPVTLTIKIAPRGVISSNTTLVSFVGVTQPAG